jgi:hypothetical protein
MVGQPSVVTDEIIQKIDENICADRCLTIDELHRQCLEMSRSVLHGYESRREICTTLKKKLVPRLSALRSMVTMLKINKSVL